MYTELAEALSEFERLRTMVVLHTRLMCAHNLAETTGWPMDKAMEMVEVSTDEAWKYAQLIQEDKDLSCVRRTQNG